MKILEIFGGIGAPRNALINLGIDHKLIDYIEIDDKAVRSYNALYPHEHKPQSVVGYDMKPDILFHGSPCFIKGAIVTTSKGYKKIEDIKVGDMVYSHDGTVNKVIETFVSNNEHLAYIKPTASHGIETTMNHPFYIYRDDEYSWKQAHELDKNDFMTIPINKFSEEPAWEGVDLHYYNHHEYVNTLPIKEPLFWEFVGRFIGDGWVNRRKNRNNNLYRTIICCGHDELEELKEVIEPLFQYTLVKERTTYKFQISSKELATFLEQFGVGAANKNIPQWVIDLDTKYLKPLIKGIMDSDGTFDGNTYKVSSVSQNLVYGFGQVILKTYRVPYSVYKSIKNKTHVIEGRTVNQRDTYQISFKLNGKTLDGIHFIKGDYLHSKIRKLNYENKKSVVYNIEVENTHSYQVHNIGTHNCQSFSRAGERLGGNKGDSTVSSLLFETLEIVRNLGVWKPKVIIWENVKGVLDKDMISAFTDYLEELEELGYNNSYKVLNSMDFGIPQARERIFVVSTLNGQFNFELLKQKPMRNINEFLENEVHEKYTIKSPSMLKRIKGNSYGRLKVIDTHCWTITTKQNRAPNAGIIDLENGQYRLLTERECWRLQGFSDEDFDRAEAAHPSKEKFMNTTLYKQSGNSITVQVCEALFEALFEQGILRRE